MADFARELGTLTAKEWKSARGDDERIAAMIEGLAGSLGVTVALACGGDGQKIDTMLAGIDAYMLERATHASAVAKIVAPLLAPETELPS